MGALGHELCLDLADGEDNLPKVHNLFKNLASLPGSQYSYMNAYIAKNEQKQPVGAIIAYDGALLHELRKEFIREAKNVLGWEITDAELEEWGDEAEPDEFYIDSLYVEPTYRSCGIATRLINHVIALQSHVGKPFGLLVEPDNLAARCLYERLGFKPAGINNFFSVPMHHLQKTL